MSENRMTPFMQQCERGESAVAVATCGAPAAFAAFPTGWNATAWQEQLYRMAYEQAREEVARECVYLRYFRFSAN